MSSTSDNDREATDAEEIHAKQMSEEYTQVGQETGGHSGVMRIEQSGLELSVDIPQDGSTDTFKVEQNCDENDSKVLQNEQAHVSEDDFQDPKSNSALIVNESLTEMCVKTKCTKNTIDSDLNPFQAHGFVDTINHSSVNNSQLVETDKQNAFIHVETENVTNNEYVHHLSVLQQHDGASSQIDVQSQDCTVFSEELTNTDCIQNKKSINETIEHHISHSESNQVDSMVSNSIAADLQTEKNCNKFDDAALINNKKLPQIDEISDLSEKSIIESISDPSKENIKDTNDKPIKLLTKSEQLVHIESTNCNNDNVKVLNSDGVNEISFDELEKIQKMLNERDFYIYEHTYIDNEKEKALNDSDKHNNFSAMEQPAELNNEKSEQAEQVSEITTTSATEEPLLVSNENNISSANATNVAIIEPLKIDENCSKESKDKISLLTTLINENNDDNLSPSIENCNKDLITEENLTTSSDIKHLIKDETNLTKQDCSAEPVELINQTNVVNIVTALNTSLETVNEESSKSKPNITNNNSQLESDAPHSSVNETESTNLIGKIQKMPWLKNHSAPDNSMGPNSKPVLKPLLKKDERAEDFFEGTKKSSNKRSRSGNSAQNRNKQEKTNNVATEMKVLLPTRTSNQQQPTPVPAPNSIWNNSTSKLFPNVQSNVIDRAKEEEEYNNAVAASICTAQKESEMRKMKEKSLKINANESDDNEWGKVQRNLPDISESEFTGDTKNNQTGNIGIVDKYGRVDGYTEKHLFMGKGARRKEQEFIKAHTENKPQPQSNSGFLQTQPFAKKMNQESEMQIRSETQLTNVVKNEAQTSKNQIVDLSKNQERPIHGRSRKEVKICAPVSGFNTSNNHKENTLVQNQEALNKTQNKAYQPQSHLNRNQENLQKSKENMDKFQNNKPLENRNQDHFNRYHRDNYSRQQQIYREKFQEITGKTLEQSSRNQNFSDRNQDSNKNHSDRSQDSNRNQNYSDNKNQDINRNPNQNYFDRNQDNIRNQNYLHRNQDRNQNFSDRNKDFTMNRNQNYFDRSHDINKNQDRYSRNQSNSSGYQDNTNQNQLNKNQMDENWDEDTQKSSTLHSQKRIDGNNQQTTNQRGSKNQFPESKFPNAMEQKKNPNLQQERKVTVDKHVTFNEQNKSKENQNINPTILKNNVVENEESKQVTINKYVEPKSILQHSPTSASHIESKISDNQSKQPFNSELSTKTGGVHDNLTVEVKPNVVMSFDGNQNIQRALGLNPNTCNTIQSIEQTSKASIPCPDLKDTTSLPTYLNQNAIQNMQYSQQIPCANPNIGVAYSNSMMNVNATPFEVPNYCANQGLSNKYAVGGESFAAHASFGCSVPSGTNVPDQHVRMNEISNSSQELIRLHNRVDTLSKELAAAQASLISAQTKLYYESVLITQGQGVPRPNIPVASGSHSQHSQEQTLPAELIQMKYSSRPGFVLPTSSHQKPVHSNYELPKSFPTTNMQDFSGDKFHLNPALEQRMNFQSMYIPQGNMYPQQAASFQQYDAGPVGPANAIPRGRRVPSNNERRDVRTADDQFYNQ